MMFDSVNDNRLVNQYRKVACLLSNVLLMLYVVDFYVIFETVSTFLFIGRQNVLSFLFAEINKSNIRSTFLLIEWRNP